LAWFDGGYLGCGSSFDVDGVGGYQGINSFVVDDLGICQGFNRFSIGRCALSSTV
jgi:hypothetical protein